LFGVVKRTFPRGRDPRDLEEGVLRPDQMLGDLDEGDAVKRSRPEGKIAVQVDHFRVEPPPAQSVDIPCEMSMPVTYHPIPTACAADAASAAADIEQLPVADGGGKIFKAN